MNELQKYIKLDTGGELVTNSLAVAAEFGKMHKHALTRCRALELKGEFGRTNFRPSSYVNAQSKLMPMFDLTEKGLAVLVLGFSGDKATDIQIAFVEAFAEMRKQIQQIGTNLWQQMHELELRDRDSKARASVGSKLMLDRRKEIPNLTAERIALEDKIQPALFAEEIN